jgi:hypothetical protein
MSGNLQRVGDRVLARPDAAGEREDERDISRVDPPMPRDADGPGKATRAQALAERRRQTVTGIGEDRPEADANGRQPVDLIKRILGLGAGPTMVLGDAGAVRTGGVARPTLRQEQPHAHRHGNLVPGKRQRNQRLAVAVLPSAEAYWGATPTECLPFFGNAVSSTTSTAFAPLQTGRPRGARLQFQPGVVGDERLRGIS